MNKQLEDAYFEYDNDQDIIADGTNRPGGSRGITLADAALKGCGNNLDRLQKWARIQRLSRLGDDYAIDRA